MPPPRETLDTRRAESPLRTLLRLLGVLRDKRGMALRLAPLHLVATVAAISWPRILGLATDAIVSRGGAPVPWGRVAGLLLGGLAATGAGCLAMRATGCIAARLSALATSRLRATLFAAVLGLPLPRLGETRRGELLSRLASDAPLAGETLAQSVLQFASSCTSLLLALCYMFWLNVPLTLAACAVLPISFIAGRALAGVSRRLFRARQEALGALNTIAEEGVSARREILACGLEDRRNRSFGNAAAKLRTLAFRAEAVGGCTGPLMNAIGNASYLIVAAFGGWMVLRGSATPGLVISFLLYARLFGRPVNELAAQFGQIQSAVAGAERVFRLADEPSEGSGGAAHFDPASVRGEIRFEHVSFRYGDGPVVIPDFSLDLPAGSTVALVGETGSGKTTLAGMIPRFHDPVSGRILLDGTDIRELPLSSLRQAVAVVPQDVRLFSGTVAENVAAGRADATPDDIAAALELSGADSFVRRLPNGAETQVGAGGASLSHGQRQLLAMARAALADPRVLILDEATSAVDPLTERRIRDAVARLFRGRTCLVVAHRLSTVRGADKIVVLDAGRVVGEGPHSELLRSCAAYRALCRAAARLAPLFLAASLALPSEAARAAPRLRTPIPSNVEISPLFTVAVGPLPRKSADLPWRVENSGTEALERLRVGVETQWAAPAGTRLPPDVEIPTLAPGESTSGVFRLSAPPMPGPHAAAVRAQACLPDGRTMRSWAQSRVWGAATAASPQTAPAKAERPEKLFSVSLRPASPGVSGADCSSGASGAPCPSAILRVQSLADKPLSLECRVFLSSGFALDGAPMSSFSAPLPGKGLFETNIAVARTSPFALSGSMRVAVSATCGDSFNWTENARAPLAAPQDDNAFPRPPSRLPLSVPIWLFAVMSLVAASKTRPARLVSSPWIDFLVAAASSLYLAWLTRLDLAVLSGATAVSGDLAAHHVLVDRIARTGHVFGRCGSWWGSFPAFRFYFPLPYVASALASKAVGHCIAFNLAVILPVVLLPTACWLGARVARFPSPAPAFLAAAALPLALDNSHTMWGGNAYSALSGMFASAWGFAILPVALGLGARDAARRRLSPLAVAAFAALVLSHFFSAILCASALGALTLALLISGRRRSAATLAVEGAAAALLCSFWLVPLVAWRGWSVDFGEQWNIDPLKQLPPAIAPPALAAAAIALAISLVISTRTKPLSAHGEPSSRSARESDSDKTAKSYYIFCVAALGVTSVVLFFRGRAISDVFVNCRLWPFAVFALLELSALAWTRLAATLRVPRLGTAAFLSLCCALAWRVGGDPGNPRSARECLVPAWAKSAWGGFENLPEAPQLRRIAAIAGGRPGVVAWDRHPGNAALGSTRVFEALPFIVPGTRTLDGGLVNGALGAIAARTVQFEISDEPRGWPLLVRPRPFAPECGLRDLEELGVRTVIARSPRLRAAIDRDPDWERIGAVEPWCIYGSRLRDPGIARAVEGLPAPPIGPRENPQRAVAAWWNSRPTTGRAPATGRWLRDAELDPDTCETRFTTDSPGKWHVVTLSAGPDWIAEGVAEGPIPLASGLIAVRPDESGRVVIRSASASSKRTADKTSSN